MKDENNWKLRKCKIKCPYSGKCCGVRTGGIDSKKDVLVNGFVKECFKMKEFKQLQLPPVYIVNIIVQWFSAEMIHFVKIQNDINNHCGIYLKDILSLCD